jgi:DNA-binding transcriptional LysR family regulator
MDLHQLRCFFEVARQNGFSRAAKALQAQQPNVSRAVRKLEEALDTKLFERNTRNISLTGPGQRLFAECQKLFEHFDRIPGVVRSTGADFHGTMQLGLTDALSPSLLAKVLRDYKAHFPNVVPSVATGLLQQIFQKLEAGQLEFGIFFADPGSIFNLSVTTLCKVPLYLVVSSRHRKNKAVMNTFISAREAEDGRITEDARDWEVLRSVSPNISIGYSANSYAIHKELVLLGYGISFLPSFMIRGELKRGSLTILNNKSPYIGALNLLVRKQRPLAAHAEGFVNLLKTRLEET